MRLTTIYFVVMKRVIQFVLSSVLTMMSAAFGFAAEELTLAVPASTLVDYAAFVEEKGGDPLVIRDFRSQWSRRGIVDVVLIRQALALGGMNNPVRLVSVPNPARALQDVKDGACVMFGHDIWESDFDDSVYMTAPVIRRGEFEVGIYASVHHPTMWFVQSLEMLREHTPVVSQSWTKDMDVLRLLGFDRIQTVPRYILIFRSLDEGRGDFTLESFTLADKQAERIQAESVALLPNFKITFPWSRHFMVSKKHPLGKQVYDALEKGLAKMRAEGKIRKAFLESGFFNDAYKDWEDLFSQRPR